MYSAIKIGGKKLYELAREGKSVDIPPRQITVDGIRLINFDARLQTGAVEVDCRKGTYIRSLIRDIAESAGTVGLMTELKRTFSGGFSLDQCFTIAEITQAENDGELAQIVMPTDRIFDLYGEIRLGARETGLYKNGVRLRAEQAGVRVCGDVFRVYGADGEFLGLGRFFDGLFGAHKNFF